MRDDSYRTLRKDSLEMIELCSIKKVNFVLVSFNETRLMENNLFSTSGGEQSSLAR